MDRLALRRALVDDEQLRRRGILDEPWTPTDFSDVRKFNPDEPRIPGGPHGGEWGHGGFVKKALKRLTRKDQGSHSSASSTHVDGRNLVDKLDLSEIARAGGADGWGAHGDERMHVIAHAQGFDGMPQVVDRKEMDRLAASKKSGAIVVYRGIADSATVPSHQRAEELRTGEAYFGAGMFGNGIYAAANQSAAAKYAALGWKAEKSHGPGTVQRMALRPGARVVDFTDLIEEHLNFMRGVPPDSDRAKAYSDIGRYAAALGYDAIRLRNTASASGDQLNILNRTALIVEAA